MSPVASLQDKIKEVQKLITRFQKQQDEKRKAPPPARFVFPIGRRLRGTPPSPDGDGNEAIDFFRRTAPSLISQPQNRLTLAQLLGQRPTRTALATRPTPVLSPERETPSLVELLGQREAISPVSARVTAPFRMPEPISISRLPEIAGGAYRPAEERAIREKLGVAELPLPKPRRTFEEIMGQPPYQPRIVGGKEIPRWQAELSDMAGIALLGIAGIQGIQALAPAAQKTASAIYGRTFGASLDRMITKRAAGMPKEQFNAFQRTVYDWFAANKPTVQESARNRMLTRMGRVPNINRAVRQAANDTVSDIEKAIVKVVPKGTQTGAMAFGGLPKPVPITKALWDGMPVAQRATQVQSAGLSGQVGSKAFEALTVAEKTVLGKVTPAPAVISPTLEYNVALSGEQVIKTPKTGFEFKVENDFNKLQQLGELAPRTEYDITNNRLIQETIQGRFATEPELTQVRKLIEAKGLVPRGLTTGDVIVTPEGNFKVVDVGNFELATPKAEAMAEAVKYPATPAGAEARAQAEGIGIAEASRLNAEEVISAEPAPAVTAKPQARRKPPAPPPGGRVPPGGKEPPPTAVVPPLEPVPPSGRPRTLLDLNREAKGMRAFSPEDRAAIMDVARPIKEDELLYRVKPFSEHADNLLQPDTPVRAALRAVPGVKQTAGAWTPAQMQRNNPVAMIGVRKAIFEEIETGRARLATLNWWHDAEELFKFQKIKGKWRATNIELSVSAEPSKPYHATIHDLIEHPGNYVFTPKQEKTLQIAQDMQRQILRDAQRVGVDAVELTGDYWRRIVTKAPEGKMFGGKVQSRIASRKGYTRQRVFDFVDDGAKLGFEYETHPLTALQNRLEAGIRTISDQNTRQAMAKLPGVVKPLERLESRYPQTLEGVKTARQARDAAKQVFLREKTVENLTALRQAEADYISAMRELFTRKIEASQPSIGELKLPNGRIAPAELVEEVRRWIDLPEIVTGRGSITNPILAVTQLLRSTLTNVDLAAGFIQGQALFYRNNIAWWRSQGNAIVSLIDDPTAYVAKNFDLMDEGMRMGAISVPTEFMFTRQGLASIPTRIPVVGPVMKSFNRAFEWFILSGQTELYRATKSGVIKRIEGEATEQKSIEALVSLGSAIRKELGTESYALLGVRPTQHTVEQLSLFAARFFRALTGIQAQAFTGGEGGREARRAMGALIAGGIALTIAASYLTRKKMPNMTDPFNPDWMQFQIGKTRFNAFGPFYPYFRTQARVSVYMLKGKPIEATNEIKRFFQGKAGIPFRAIDMAAQFGVKGSYRTFEGKTLPFSPFGVGEAVLGELAVPISVQEAMRALPQGRPEAVAGEVFGLVGREKYPWFPKETFDTYYAIPANADEAKAQKKGTRAEYRKTHPTVEAQLFITGRIDTISTDMAIEAVIKLVRENKIDPDSISGVKANNEKRAKRRELGLPVSTKMTLTDKLVARLGKLEFTPIKKTPAPVAPATKPKIVLPEGYVPSWAR